jgi:hypothetical protein
VTEHRYAAGTDAALDEKQLLAPPSSPPGHKVFPRPRRERRGPKPNYPQARGLGGGGVGRPRTYSTISHTPASDIFISECAGFIPSGGVVPKLLRQPDGFRGLPCGDGYTSVRSTLSLRPVAPERRRAARLAGRPLARVPDPGSVSRRSRRPL